MGSPLISLSGVRREFPAGEQTIAVLKNVDLTIEAGEMVAIVGASGSGKSTLMNILGCLDRPTSGDYRVSGAAPANSTPTSWPNCAASTSASSSSATTCWRT